MGRGEREWERGVKVEGEKNGVRGRDSGRGEDGEEWGGLRDEMGNGGERRWGECVATFHVNR